MRRPLVAPLPSGDFEALEPRTLLVIAVPYVNGPLFIQTTNSPHAIEAPSEPVRLRDEHRAWHWLGGPDTISADSLISLDDFRADPRFAGIDGGGSTVVVLDTGIDLNHPAFGPDADGNGVADRIVYQHDFGDGDANATDANGHGSNVSSIIGSASSAYPGVAPGVNLIHLKVFTNAGSGAFGMIESALQWVVAHAAEYNVVAVNMSLGDTLNHNAAGALYGVGDEILALAQQGVIVVCAAGNSFYTFGSAPGVAYPASDPYSLAVGAVFDSSLGQVSYGSGAVAYSSGPDRVTPFSQRSTGLLDVFAPGAAILGAGPTGNTVAYHGTSQAAPHVAGVVALIQQLAMRELGRFLSFGEFRSLLVSSADAIVDGDDENDNVVNTGATFGRLDVMALAEAVLAIAPPDAPEIAVRDGDETVIDGLGRVAFAATTEGQPVDRALTIMNLGLLPLTLDGAVVLPDGFSVAPGGGFTAATLAYGESATLTIRLDASAVGDFGGTLSIICNDSDENTFDITLTGRVAGPTTIIDDGAAGSTRVGTWTTVAAGYQGDIRTSPSGSGSNYAQWTFSNLPSGRYRVSVTYTTGSTRATNASYGIWEGPIRLGTAAVNQRIAPADRTEAGANWEDLGVYHLNTGLSLVVKLTNKANGVVAADAVRIERLGDLPASSEIMVFVGTAGGTELADGASVGFGTTPVLTGVSKTFTIANIGGAALTLSPTIALPAGYTLVAGPGATTLAPGTTTTFSVRMTGAALGAPAGVMSIASDDPDETSFDVTLSGTVTAIFRDDGAAGFATAGTWSISTGGYLNDYRAAAAGSGSNNATWTFSGLVPGSYRVSITYVPGSTRATNAPFTVRNGAVSLGTFGVNQRVAPASLFDANRWWRDLGSFTITGTTLVVRLTNVANGSVVADGVRIEPV